MIPRYTGKRYEWRIGETSDDTEQTLAVARALLPDGIAEHQLVGRELLQCKKSVHPDVSIGRFQQTGDPAHIAVDGDGCGAAMRMAPVGIVFSTHAMETLVRAAYQCSIPTHGGSLAISAAAAVAGAVSAALENRSPAGVLEASLAAARQTEALMASRPEPGMAECIERVHNDLVPLQTLDSAWIAERYFPDRTAIIVPLAIALALKTRSAEQTTLIASNIGGDSDSVASIGAAIAGAIQPETIREDWFAVVSRLNGDALIQLAGSLVRLRR